MNHQFRCKKCGDLIGESFNELAMCLKEHEKKCTGKQKAQGYPANVDASGTPEPNVKDVKEF